jgi:hypothetical protein
MEKGSCHSPQVARVYRAVGKSALGVRASYVPDTGTVELLVEVPSEWSSNEVVPEWAGMGHELLELVLQPRTAARQLRLFLKSTEHRPIFSAVCDDIVRSLESASNADQRARQVTACLVRWRRFFDRVGTEGLTWEMQQGLFAELVWFAKALDAQMHPHAVLDAWKGCERDYHDFDFRGQAIEVKSTRAKEPQSVVVNNERQLDDRGLRSLHLLVIGLQSVEGGGRTLPELITQIGEMFQSDPLAQVRFEDCLVAAGYHAQHADKYTSRWIVTSERLFQVVEGFPRIIDLPPGVGEIRYRVVVGACEKFKINSGDYVSNLKRSYDG